jgi:hypothetical protein
MIFWAALSEMMKGSADATTTDVLDMFDREATSKWVWFYFILRYYIGVNQIYFGVASSCDAISRIVTTTVVTTIHLTLYEAMILCDLSLCTFEYQVAYARSSFLTSISLQTRILWQTSVNLGLAFFDQQRFFEISVMISVQELDKTLKCLLSRANILMRVNIGDYSGSIKL